MSDQALDLRRSAQIVRRHKVLIGAIAALGLLAGAGYTVYKPPMFTSQVYVTVPYAADFAGGSAGNGGSAAGTSATGNAADYAATQAVIAHSDPVLSGASPEAGMSLATLRKRVQAAGLTSNVILISAEGQTAAQAQATANAVADSYVDYLGSARSAVGRVRAKTLGATAATRTPLYTRFLESAGIGILAGALIGAIVALAIGRGHQRLRERDQIADSIGVPVLASVSAEHPRNAAGWAKLFEHYKPSAVDAWRLRVALHQLGLVGLNPADPAGSSGSGAGSGSSLSVLSLSSDRNALALGPQLAAFAASLGIPAALVVGPQQGENATATLYAACAAAPTPQRRSGNLLVTVSGHHTVGEITDAVLTIAVGVIDGQDPRVSDTVHATTTVLGVSAGAATAEQLARVAASAAADGRHVVGILVADPDPADKTTGRLPQVGRPQQRRMPTRILSTATDTRR